MGSEEDRYGGIDRFSLFINMQFQLVSPKRRNSVLIFYRIFCLQNYKIVNTVETLCLHYRDSYLIRWRLHAQATKFQQAEM
jgi:hypothetical protein